MRPGGLLSVSGWKPRRGDYALPRLRPYAVGRLLSRLTEPFATRFPRQAFALLAIRDMEAAGSAA